LPLIRKSILVLKREVLVEWGYIPNWT
jgi:hypothetical protein